MRYALNLGENNRVLSATFKKYAKPEQPLVDVLPVGNIFDYLYIDGEYVFDPLPVQKAELFATANYEAGKVFMEDGNLFRATESISTHERIIPGANCETVTIADALNALNKEE